MMGGVFQTLIMFVVTLGPYLALDSRVFIQIVSFQSEEEEKHYKGLNSFY